MDGTFFAIPYIGLSVGIVPSLLIGGAAFGAGELILRKTNNDDNLENKEKTLSDELQEAREKNKKISNMVSKVEDAKLKEDITQISETVTKIINTIENKPQKAEKMNTFFSYYLPRTLDILNRYDEIENQDLTNEESKKFMRQTQDMMEKINKSFKILLSSLYQAEMVDTDAEMKVFDSMLKADGYDSNNDFKREKNEF